MTEEVRLWHALAERLGFEVIAPVTLQVADESVVFTSASESPLMTTIYSDFITDWTAGDRIDLSGFDANESIAGNQAFVFGGYSFGHPPTVTTAGTFTIGGFGGELYITGYTNNIAGADFQIAIWSPLGESGLRADQIFF